MNFSFLIPFLTFYNYYIKIFIKNQKRIFMSNSAMERVMIADKEF